ncbi:MAG: ABC transporter permease [Anaerolineales bacterium]
MNQSILSRIGRKHPYLFALVLLVIAIIVNFILQPNLMQLRVLNQNVRIFLPLMLVAAGQTIVIIGGGIDLSVGAIVAMVNTLLIVTMPREATSLQIAQGIFFALALGAAAGVLNGLAVAYLRLQPIITTYASGFIFSGIALYILPRPGGNAPSVLTELYRSTPLNIPFVAYVIVATVGLWILLRSTRYGRYLYASGGDPEAAYATGVPVDRVRFSTYVLAGILTAAGALALTLSTGTGDPRIGGDQTTLDSIVAVVVGGTRLSGGQGGVIGSMIGVVILGLIRNIISFANVPSWWQTLVDALIIIGALAGPGAIRLIRGRRSET